jgi:hypothetical protein
LDPNICKQSAWSEQTHANAVEDPINQSFSGQERNRFYSNHPSNNGRDFREQSMLSGLDSIADGRGFAIGDFNHDGRPDLALCNANAPVLQLFENQIESENNFIALRFEGAARIEANAAECSCRDGYGAVVKLTLDNGQTLLREFRCGEGFAAQNSDTMLVGIGEARAVTQLEIEWPSGVKQMLGPIRGGELLVLNESESSNQSTPTRYNNR